MRNYNKQLTGWDSDRKENLLQFNLGLGPSGPSKELFSGTKESMVSNERTLYELKQNGGRAL